MARVRLIGPQAVTVPELGEREIQPDEVVTVPDSRFAGYICQPQTWEAVEEPPGWNDPAPVEPDAEPERHAVPQPPPAKSPAALKTTAKATTKGGS